MGVVKKFHMRYAHALPLATPLAKFLDQRLILIVASYLVGIATTLNSDNVSYTDCFEDVVYQFLSLGICGVGVGVEGDGCGGACVPTAYVITYFIRRCIIRIS